jgi:hypothetical protein
MRSKNNNKVAVEKQPKDFSKVISLAMLFVVGSIAFSTYVVYFGTTSMTAKVMLVPQALFAAIVAVRQFTK